MRNKRNVAKALIIITFCIIKVISTTGQATNISSYDYRGDKESFAAFKVKYGKEYWPEPEKIAYFDPDGTEPQVIRYAHWVRPTGASVVSSVAPSSGADSSA